MSAIIEAKSSYAFCFFHLRGYSIDGARREINLGDVLEIQFPIG